MKSDLNLLPRFACSFFSAALLLFLPTLVQAENHFLGNIPAGTSTYKAIARIGVDTPNTNDPYNPSTKEFNFDGVVDYVFEVTGDIQIWRSGPLDNFNDPITNASVGAAADGLNTLRMEMVKLSGINIVNPSGATITSIKLGDEVTGGTNSGAFFSTGGAAEIAPLGSSANGFLNLFLEVNITQPNIVAGNINFPIGALHNNSVLHLEAVIDKFAPAGISFLQTGGPVGFFAPANHPLVLALAALPAPFNRPASQMQFARFITTDLQIVPEPSSVVFGLIAVGAFGTLAWRRRRVAMTA